jgi:hypothetical protein
MALWPTVTLRLHHDDTNFDPVCRVVRSRHTSACIYPNEELAVAGTTLPCPALPSPETTR